MTTTTTTDTALTPTTIPASKRAPRKPAPRKPTASKPRTPKPAEPRKATPVAPTDRFTALWSAYHTHQTLANEAFAAAMSILNPVPIELPPNTPMTRPW